MDGTGRSVAHEAPKYKHLFSTSFEPDNPLRVIAHCDVDAAYAQFEAARLGLDCGSVPIAVLQWNGLIAVNYAARKYGISRFSGTPAECKQKCPELQLIHVATYGPGDTEPQYRPRPQPSRHKVSLDLYRRESKKILEIFQYCVAEQTASGAHSRSDLQETPPGSSVWPHALRLEPKSIDTDIVVEKASIDESFFDLSLHVRRQLLQRFPFLNVPEEELPYGLETPLPPLPFDVREELSDTAWEHLGAWRPENATSPELSWVDVAMAIGAERMIAVRRHVREMLGYTTSAGIAENKALAKLCASHRKPCNQTMLLPQDVTEFLRHLPFQNVRMLGGKLGAAIAEEWQHSTVGELWDVSQEQLEARFGPEGAWVYGYLRGVDPSEVSSRTGNQSMLSSKNFRPGIPSTEKGLYWVSVMASELCRRLREEQEQDPSLFPRTLLLKYTLFGAPSPRSVQMPLGYAPADQLLGAVERAGAKLWKDSIGVLMSRAGRPGDVLVINLLLGFTGIERSTDGQRRLDAFFSAGRKRGTDDQEEPRKRVAGGDVIEKRGMDHGAAAAPSTDTPAADAVPADDTATVEWSCEECAHRLSIPIITGDEGGAHTLLEQLRTEHMDWHMAVAISQGP